MGSAFKNRGVQLLLDGVQGEPPSREGLLAACGAAPRGEGSYVQRAFGCVRRPAARGVAPLVGQAFASRPRAAPRLLLLPAVAACRPHT